MWSFPSVPCPRPTVPCLPPPHLPCLTLCLVLLTDRTFENLDACEVLFSPSLATAASLLEVSERLLFFLSEGRC